MPSSFVSHVSPITGMIQWNLVDDDYDFEQEIARSAYADMLHDTDRNRRYHEAIHHVITTMKADKKTVNVLDIGTGTGLLAMMAARAGADSVVACEAFDPVAKCAKRIIAANGMADKVRLIHKRSTDLKVGKDMPCRANVLVAELFDTELIGEAALETYRHAAEHLLTSDAILIPCKARLYLQVVESPFLWSHNRLASLEDQIPFPTRDMKSCRGCPTVFDLQVSRLVFVDEAVSVNSENTEVRCLLETPMLFHEFEFSPPASTLKFEEFSRMTDSGLIAKSSGTAHALIVWWDLQMEPSNTIPAITMVPECPALWSGSRGERCGKSTWREHWMQAVYFPHEPLTLSIGDQFCLDFAHDSVSMWFDLHPFPTYSPISVHRPVCTCLAHMAWPRSRFAELNTRRFQRNALCTVEHVCQQISALESETLIIVVLSDASILPFLIFNSMRPRRATHIHLECSLLSTRVMQSIYHEAGVDIMVKDSFESLFVTLKSMADNAPSPINVCLVAEPFGLTSVLPWNSIQFWYLFGQIKQHLPQPHVCHLLAPKCLRICAVAMEFEHLWKIRAPIGPDCEGFDLQLFDSLILSASHGTDASVEPQPLWQYTGKARSEKTLLFELPLTDPLEFLNNDIVVPQSLKILSEQSVTIRLSSPSVNAIALWAEWQIGDYSDWHMVAGPVKPIKVDQEVEWCKTGPHTGVYLLKTDQIETLRLQEQPCSLRVTGTFDFHTGEPSFQVGVLSRNDDT